MTAILGVVIAVATSISSTTDGVDALTYTLTGTANAHREVEKWRLRPAATRRRHGEILERRGLMGRAAALALPGLLHRSDPNPQAPLLVIDLKELDRAIAANEQRAPSDALRVAVAQSRLISAHVRRRGVAVLSD